MKKILLLFAIMFIGLAVSGQVYNRSYVTDTVQGAETVYFTSTNPIYYYSGLVGFQFSKADVADSLSALKLQGAYSSDFTGAVNLTGTGALLETSTDGNTLLYDSAPKYLYYRLAATCAAGDTVIFTNVKFVYKKTNSNY